MLMRLTTSWFNDVAMRDFNRKYTILVYCIVVFLRIIGLDINIIALGVVNSENKPTCFSVLPYLILIRIGSCLASYCRLMFQ